jgi:hypothetical protein
MLRRVCVLLASLWISLACAACDGPAPYGTRVAAGTEGSSGGEGAADGGPSLRDASASQ